MLLCKIVKVFIVFDVLVFRFLICLLFDFVFYVILRVVVFIDVYVIVNFDMKFWVFICGCLSKCLIIVYVVY